MIYISINVNRTQIHLFFSIFLKKNRAKDMADIAGVSCVKCNKFIPVKATFNGSDVDSFYRFIDNVPLYRTFKYRYFKNGNETYQYKTFRSDKESSSIYVTGVSVNDEEVEFPAKDCEFYDSSDPQFYIDFVTKYNNIKLATKEDTLLYYKSDKNPSKVFRYSYDRSYPGKLRVKYINGESADQKEKNETIIHDTDFYNQESLKFQYMAGRKIHTIHKVVGGNPKTDETFKAWNEETLKARDEVALEKIRTNPLLKEDLLRRANPEILRRKPDLRGKTIIIIADSKYSNFYLKIKRSKDIYMLTPDGSFENLDYGPSDEKIKGVENARKALLEESYDPRLVRYAKLYYCNYFKKSDAETAEFVSSNALERIFGYHIYSFFDFIYTATETYNTTRQFTKESFGIVFI